MANDTDKSPARRIEDRLPDAEIQWDKPGAPAVPKSNAADTSTNAAAGEPAGWRLVPIEPTEDMVTAGFESRPDQFFSAPEVWAEYDAMTGCQQAAHRARLCWAAMLANAPIPPLTAPAPLTDYVLMPKRLTAENGAKGALSGEFKESIRITCHECDGSGEGENNEDCIECKGEGTVDAAVTVGWDTIKDIYKAAVALLAKAAPAAPVQTAETLEIVETVRTAMRRAYSLGQTYWQQADSEYTSQNKKADVTAGRFIELIDDTCAKVESSVAAPVQAEQAQAEPAFWYDARAKLEKMDLIDGAHQAHLLVCNERFGDYTTPLYHAAPALPAQAEQAEAVRADYSIRPVKVERDENGWWTHPAIPNFDDDHKSFAAWVKAVGLETKYKCLESYPEHPLYDAWFEHGECNASSWEPEEPAGEGWFTFSIHDTEDGPVWVWARALAAPSTATSNDTGALGDTGGAK